MISIRPLFICATLIPAMIDPASAAGDPPYTFTDLGTLGGTESVAYGLNDNREVVGWSTIPGCTTPNGFPCRRAYHWKDGVMTDLGLMAGDEESFARAINNNGQIVGTSENNVIFGSGTYHGVTWIGGVLVALPDLGNGTSFAHDINEAGLIAGHSVDPVPMRDRAVIWQGGSIFNAGATEPHSANRAYGINDLSHIAGFAWDLFTPNDSIVFDGAWKVIGGTDSPWQNSEARDINNNGVVVGYQAFPSGNWHAAYWDAGAKSATDAGLLPTHDLSELFDVNEAGIAVGSSYQENPPFESRAILFDGKTLVDLNDLLPVGSGVHLYEAREINEHGDIAGTALVGGVFHAFLLSQDKSWVELGGALAGAGGAPELEAFGSLEGGAPVELRISNVPAAAPVFLVAGVSQANLPLFGGLLVPSMDYLFTPLSADSFGEATIAFAWPAGVAPGVDTFWQTWALDATGPVGFTASNAVTATTP